jgi:3-oxoacyl-[acyl-carrier-protein] synthase II
VKQPISITGFGSLSPLGTEEQDIFKKYLEPGHQIQKHKHGFLAAPIDQSCKKQVHQLKLEDNKYKNLDKSVLYAIIAARKAVKSAQWNSASDFGVNIGSSRGATHLFERYYQDFLENSQAATLSSPTTTLGNISSWVAHDLHTQGPEISHSITCSTALHALLNGVAWIKSGLKDKFLVGGSEAALTPFTIAQMKAMKIYAKQYNQYPCRALDLNKTSNTMVLGEGAAMACLEAGIKENTLAIVQGVGYATEPLKHNISISTDAVCFQKSMKMALGPVLPNEVDVVVMHAPGTIKGDISEFNAIKKVFCNKLPALTTNKWKIGHTFGASGMLSVEMALLMLQHQQFIPVPFISSKSLPDQIDKVLVNAVGFGGNAVSILLSKCE